MCVGHKLVPADPLELFIAVKVVLNLMKVTYFNLPNMGHFFRDTLYYNTGWTQKKFDFHKQIKRGW